MIEYIRTFIKVCFFYGRTVKCRNNKYMVCHTKWNSILIMQLKLKFYFNLLYFLLSKNLSKAIYFK